MTSPPRGWVVTAATGLGLMGGSWLALRHPLSQRADVRAGDALRWTASPPVDRAVTATTDLGSLYSVVGIGATLALTGRRRLAADVLGAGGTAWSVAQASKTGVRRQRPYEADGVRRLVSPPAGSSFPSGHAAVGMAVMTVLAERSHVRIGPPLLRAIGAYIAASRVYVGVHYPTDVLGGVGMGLAVAALWRGPVAAGARGLLSLAAASAGRAGPPLVRAGAWALLGVRRR